MRAGCIALLFLLMSATATVALAETDYCVDDAAVRCTDSIPTADVQDETALDAATTPADAAPVDFVPDAATPTTRTIGPPTFVNPFAQTAAPATTQIDTPSQPNPPQRLPPGPPNRFP